MTLSTTATPDQNNTQCLLHHIAQITIIHGSERTFPASTRVLHRAGTDVPETRRRSCRLCPTPCMRCRTCAATCVSGTCPTLYVCACVCVCVCVCAMMMMMRMCTPFHFKPPIDLFFTPSFCFTHVLWNLSRVAEYTCKST